MKKVFTVSLILLFCIFMIVGCRARLNSTNESIAKTMIATIDAYLEGKKTATDAAAEIEAEIDKIDENDATDEAASGVATTLLGSHASMIKIELSTKAYDDSIDIEMIKEYRNKIAALIGEPAI